MNVPAAELGPLSGRTVAVPADGAAARHARTLVAQFGAHVCDVTSPADVRIDLAPTAAIHDWATSGAMALTAIGDGRPSPEHAGVATALRAGLAVTGALSAARTGTTPSLPGVELLGERAAATGLLGSRRRGASASGATRTVATRDGWCAISLPRDADREVVPALVQDGVDGDSWGAIRHWAAHLSTIAVVERAQLLGLAAAAIPATRDAPMTDPQTSYRGSQPVATSRGGRRTRRATPLVVDLSSLWAGPLCASLLAMTGADIVKVEDVRRLDGARQGPAHLYDLLHAGHASVVVDMSSPAGRDELRQLVMAADVVIESSRPRALRQLGIDAEEISRAGTIWASLTAYGRGGPWSNRVGFGDDIAAGAGLVAMLDGVPAPCGDAVADPLAGVHAAAAVSAALLTERGWLLDVSMRDVAAAAARIPVEPCQVTPVRDGGWHVGWADGRCRVAAPRVRETAGHAAAPGTDNARLLGSEKSAS